MPYFPDSRRYPHVEIVRTKVRKTPCYRVTLYTVQTNTYKYEPSVFVDTFTEAHDYMIHLLNPEVKR